MLQAVLSDHRRRRRLLGYAGVGLGVVLGLSFLHEWQARLSDRHDRIEQEIGRLKILLREAPGWQAAKRSLDESALAEGAVFRETSDSLAIASLQERVVGMIRSQGGLVRSVQSLPVEREADETRLRLNIDFTVDSAALIAVLETLETGLPILILDDTRIRGAAQFGQSGDEHPVDIHVQTRIGAFLEETR